MSRIVNAQKIKILSFDPGTENTGYSLLLGNLRTSEVSLNAGGVIKTKKAEGDIRKRIDAIGKRINELITEEKPTHIVMEDFIEQGVFTGKIFKEMAFLLEHIRMVCRYKGYEVTIYENGEWKRKTLKASRANKEQVKHYVSTKLPKARELLKNAPDHVWDSVAIGLCKFLELTGGRLQ